MTDGSIGNKLAFFFLSSLVAGMLAALLVKNKDGRRATSVTVITNVKEAVFIVAEYKKLSRQQGMFSLLKADF